MKRASYNWIPGRRCPRSFGSPFLNWLISTLLGIHFPCKLTLGQPPGPTVSFKRKGSSLFCQTLHHCAPCDESLSEAETRHAGSTWLEGARTRRLACFSLTLSREEPGVANAGRGRISKSPPASGNAKLLNSRSFQLGDTRGNGAL